MTLVRPTLYPKRNSSKETKMKTKTQTLTRLAILSALIFLLCNLPIKIGIIEITLGMIPVAIGAITMGPINAMFLGAVFGTASLLQCFGVFIPSPFGQTVLSINPFFTVLLCYLPRILMGLLVALIFKAFKKKNAFAYGTSALSAAVLNTVFFVPLAMLFFWNTGYFKSLCDFFGTDNFFLFAVAFAGVNAVVEAIVCCVLGGAGAKAVDTVSKRLK